MAKPRTGYRAQMSIVVSSAERFVMYLRPCINFTIISVAPHDLYIWRPTASQNRKKCLSIVGENSVLFCIRKHISEYEIRFH